MMIPDDVKDLSPIVVGGLSGSGTRVPVMYLAALGVEMFQGESLHWDCQVIRDRIWGWVKDYHDAGLSPERLRAELAGCVAEMHRGRPIKGPWGWKNPPNIVLLPAFHEIMPRMRFIHVMRNGLDVKTGHMRRWILKYLGKEPKRRNLIGDYMNIWYTVNMTAAAYGARMGANYLRLRLEDIVPRNKEILNLIAEFAGIKPEIKNREVWRRIIKSRMLGQHKIGREVSDHHLAYLRRFGYG